MDPRAEVERICRVSDMLCTGHAFLRDRYARLALFLDVSILAASTWMVSLSFVDQAIQKQLTPFTISPPIWIGLMGVITFFASMIQLYVKWKEKSAAHDRSVEIYSELKREAKYLLSVPAISPESLKMLVDKNALAAIGACKISEAWFLRIKRAHLTKVEVSKYLDTHPSASIVLVRAYLWWRSNKGGK